MSKVVRYYYLFTMLVKRNIKKKYKGSVLGIIWSLLNPLLHMIVLIFLCLRPVQPFVPSGNLSATLVRH